MIDLTSVQLFEAAPDILKLQTQNKVLLNKNSDMQDLLILCGLVGATYLGYKLYIKYIKSQSEKGIQKDKVNVPPKIGF